MKKNPISVAGGRSRSPARAAASKANGKAMGPRTIAAYREGWSAGVQRAAEQLRAFAGWTFRDVERQNEELRELSDRIAAEPAPRKDGGK